VLWQSPPPAAGLFYDCNSSSPSNKPKAKFTPMVFLFQSVAYYVPEKKSTESENIGWQSTLILSNIILFSRVESAERS